MYMDRHETQLEVSFEIWAVSTSVLHPSLYIVFDARFLWMVARVPVRDDTDTQVGMVHL